MKTLKILVAGMGLLIVIGLALLGWGMSRTVSKPVPPAGVSALPVPPAALSPTVSSAVQVAAPASVSAPGGYFSADVALPVGGRVEQVLTTADRVIVRVAAPDGEHLMVVDPQNGHLSGTVALSPSAR